MVRKVLMVIALTVTFVVALAVPAFAQDTGGGGDFGALGPAVLALVELVGVLILGSRGITFLVDRARDALPFGDDARYKIVWGLLALAIGLYACLGFGVNTIGDALAALPNGTTQLQNTAGEVITAIVLAGLASSWHDRDVAKNPPLSPE